MSGQAAAGSGGVSGDGTTYISPSGKIEYGITDPITHQFLPNGEVRSIDGHQVYGSVQGGVFYSEDGTLLQRPGGVVEHGFTDAHGYFHSERTVDGQVLFGSDTGGGGWISDDGTVAVGKDGTVEHGITDPSTHQFLPNGEVRSIDGHQMYGSVQGGVFYSEDGTLLQRPGGVVEHGFTDARGYFHSQRTVDGQVLYGSDTTDGGWTSDDGTVFVDKHGKVEHGISTPDGQFLPGGTTHTMPDGTTLYGYKTGNDFYSSDGTTIVLSNGTVVHGSTDKNTGIFTPNTGAGVYFISNTGILYGHYDPKDGSIAFSDGSRYMTPQAWRVDLHALSDAIVAIQREKGIISDTLDQIESKIGVNLEAYWRGPAKNTFDPVHEWYTRATLDLMDILDEILRRMRKSYDNYHQAELQNSQNMTPTGNQSLRYLSHPSSSGQAARDAAVMGHAGDAARVGQAGDAARVGQARDVSRAAGGQRDGLDAAAQVSPDSVSRPRVLPVSDEVTYLRLLPVSDNPNAG